jgi:hypothetical protein
MYTVHSMTTEQKRTVALLSRERPQTERRLVCYLLGFRRGRKLYCGAIVAFGVIFETKWASKTSGTFTKKPNAERDGIETQVV